MRFKHPANNDKLESANHRHTKKTDATAPVTSSLARLRVFLEEVAS